MSNIGKYYNYLSLSETTTTTSFSRGNKEEDKYNQYSPSGMFTTSFNPNARRADGGGWDGGQHGDGHDDAENYDPASGDPPRTEEDLVRYAQWFAEMWNEQNPTYQGAANTMSRLNVTGRVEDWGYQEWYDFFYELFGFGGDGHQGGGGFPIG